MRPGIHNATLLKSPLQATGLHSAGTLQRLVRQRDRKNGSCSDQPECKANLVPLPAAACCACPAPPLLRLPLPCWRSSAALQAQCGCGLPRGLCEREGRGRETEDGLTMSKDGHGNAQIVHATPRVTLLPVRGAKRASGKQGL